MSEPAHLILRRETRGAHDRVDALFGQVDLGRRGPYQAFLLAHAAALIPAETALEAGGVGDLVADWPSRRRTAAMLADLAALGLRPPVAGSPVTPDLPATPAALLGATYVLEGSRLGGSVLARQVGPGLPTAYLAAGQPAPGAWRGLLALLDRTLYTGPQVAIAISAAQAMFFAFERAGRQWLERKAA